MTEIAGLYLLFEIASYRGNVVDSEVTWASENPKLLVRRIEKKSKWMGKIEKKMDLPNHILQTIEPLSHYRRKWPSEMGQWSDEKNKFDTVDFMIVPTSILTRGNITSSTH